MIAVSCKYAPEELFAGFEEEILRLNPSPSSFSCAESCTHPNMCSFAKAVIEQVKEKQISEIVLTDCCDAVRRAYDVLKKDPSIKFSWILPLPHKNGDAEIRYFAEDLKKLCEAYERFSGRPFQAEKAVQAYIDQHSDLPSRPDGKYINILGAHGGSQLLQAVRKTFPDLPVMDDTCSGYRYLRHEAGSAKDFFQWYAEALLNQEMPCMRMWRNAGRIPDGNLPFATVFHTVKFCDYYDFEYIMMHDSSHKMIHLETDMTSHSSGQLHTRLEAFREELGYYPSKNMTRQSDKKYVCGIDSGSASTDAVIMDRDKNIIGSCVLATGAASKNGAAKALELVLEQAHLKREDLAEIVTTGYGRNYIQQGDESITEISCHAKGAHFLDPSVRTVIDIGGQDSKVISVDEEGNVVNFVMNDKCAAGTGRFLEMQAEKLQMSMAEMSRIGLQWKKNVTISSMCTVFAESEVVSLVAENVDPADIIHGLNKSVAVKTAALVNRLHGKPVYMMTGGVARNKGVVKCLEEKLHEDISVSVNAQICGSIGACLFALDRLKSAENG